MFFFSKKKRVYVSLEKNYTYVYKEFVYRSAYFFLCIAFSCTSAWIYQKEVLFVYFYPLISLHQNIIFTSISEAFTCTLGLCISLGFAFSFPLFFYLFFCFFCGSLFPEERACLRKACFFILSAYIIALTLCSFYVIPELCFWFLKYEVSTNFLALSLQAKASSYISWSGKMYVYCVFILQIPNVYYSYFFFLHFFDKNGTASLSQKSVHSRVLFSRKFHGENLYTKGLLPINIKCEPWCFEQQAVKNPDSLKLGLEKRGFYAPTYIFKSFFKNRMQSSVCLLLLCATISPPDVFSQGSLFALFLGAYEISLWFRFLRETVTLWRIKKNLFYIYP